MPHSSLGLGRCPTTPNRECCASRRSETRRSLSVRRSADAALCCRRSTPNRGSVANKVVQKYQTSTCQQLMQAQALQQPPPAEEKAMGMLRSDSEMCHEFVSIVADPVIDKLT